MRCTYCMPEVGMKFQPREQILSYEEMLRLVHIMSRNGVNKVRITGGEPFVRKDLLYFLEQLSRIQGIEKIGITTNGVLTRKYLPDLKRLGILDVNLSIDSIDRENFREITKRDALPEVERTMYEMIQEAFKLKLNVVVLSDKNIHELPNLAAIAQKEPVEVRFIEEMPFNGGNKNEISGIHWNAKRIAEYLSEHFVGFKRLSGKAEDTAHRYTAEGFKGSIGIIPAYTRTICGGCNRIRVTADGKLKTCLYDDGKHNLKSLLRDGSTDQAIEDHLKHLAFNKAKDGFEAQKRIDQTSSTRESMSIIGG